MRHAATHRISFARFRLLAGALMLPLPKTTLYGAPDSPGT
jgi:hypothetical protein